MQMVELAQAVRAARSGDKGAVEALYRHYRKRLWFFVCRNIDSQQAAEDIVSDSFLTAIEKLSELRCDEAFGSSPSNSEDQVSQSPDQNSAVVSAALSRPDYRTITQPYIYRF
ncbi:MAG: hypothetical protein II574_03340, partial [Ruminococcus sp.]|nr:hypothetical protein [Ruminococcus sp.]